MLKYFSKFFLEILPSVVATVVGAYIVNHYIAPRPGAEAPKAAAVSAVNSTQSEPPKAAVTPDAAPARETASVRERDAKARAVDKAAEKATAKAQAERILADKPAEPSRQDPEPRRFVTREKAAEKVAPSAQAPSDTASTAATAAPAASEDHPDAAELARAALNRLRTTNPSAKPAESTAPAVVARETPREDLQETSRAAVVTAGPTTAEQTSASVPPLPPPVLVAPPVERASAGNAPGADTPRTRASENDHLVPPADIPAASEPGDLQVATARPKTKSVADDMLSAARSVFQSVVPQ